MGPIVVECKGTQTDGPMIIDPQQIEKEIAIKFEGLFENILREKMQTLKQDNDEWKQFLKDKLAQTNAVQNEYRSGIENLQTEIFDKFKQDIVKKWKGDVTDCIEQLDDHASNVQLQQLNDNRQFAVNPLQRTGSSESII